MPTNDTAQLVHIDGPDAIAFAQAQFSSNVLALPNGQWQFSAWLDAQGRVRVLFHLARLADERLRLLLRGGDAEPMVDALRRYVFRSRVTLTASTAQYIATGAALPAHIVDVHGDIVQLGCGTHSLRINNETPDNDWRYQQITQGWPWLPLDALNEVLPPALSLHRLGGVSIDKGCYPGQEIVARMHYRGAHKRHLHRVTLSRHVEAGTVLRRNEREFVRLLDVMPQQNSAEALAIIADEIASDMAQHKEISSDDGIYVVSNEQWTD